MIEHVTLSRASELLGVTNKTLREWDRLGKIKVIRTEGGHRRVSVSEIRRLQNLNPEDQRLITLAYCRCSTKRQEENLERQIGRVLEYCCKRAWQVELFKDIGSGLNDQRKDYKRLMKRINQPDVKRVVVEYQDRLARFGYHTFKNYCENLGVEVIAIEESAVKEFEQELVDDMIALVTAYSARLYGRRGGRQPKQKKEKTS